MRRGWWLSLVVALSLLAGCECAQLPSDVLFRCEGDSTCPTGAFCGADGYCHPLTTSDSGFPCEAPPDAGFLFQANVCSPQGWCWQHPLPVGSDLQDVRGTSKGEVYFSGTGGLVMKFDGTSFTGVKTPGTVTQDVRALWGRGDETLYALGAFGTVLYSPDGAEFTVFSQFLGENGVSLAGWEDVMLWAGSDNGSIWELNLINPQWRRTFATGGGIWLHALHAKSAGEVWAVGEIGAVAIRAETAPGRWTHTGGPYFQDAGRPELFGVVALPGGGDGVLVAGEQGFLGQVTVDRFTDGGLDLIATPERARSLTAATIRDLWQGPGGTVWAVGTGGFTSRRESDGTWTDFDIPDAGTLLAAWGADDAEPWAVGSRGALKRRACDKWQDVDYRASTRRLNGVFHTPGAAWAVGEFGTVMRRAGGRWELTAANRFPVTSALNDVWGSSDTDVVVAGQDGLLATWDGTSWRAVNLMISNPPTFNRIYARDVNDVWVLGNNESYVRRTNGTWGTVQRLQSVFGNLNGIAFGQPGELWLTGDNNIRVQHSTDDGMTWSTEDQGLPGGWVGAIARTENGDLWVGGSFSELYRLPSGTSNWVSVQLGVGNFRQPWSVCALPGNRVAFAGAQGLLGVATDLGGTVHVPYTGRDFEDLDCDPTAGAMAVGENAHVVVLPP